MKHLKLMLVIVLSGFISHNLQAQYMSDTERLPLTVWIPDDIEDFPPAAADVLKGKPAFEANCAACHQATGKGLPGAFPPLAGSDWLQGKAPSQVAEVVLRGLQGAVVVNGVTYDNVMPSQSGINDADIAAIVTYVLNQWGNPGGSISADEVKALRVTPDAGPAKPR